MSYAVLEPSSCREEDGHVREFTADAVELKTLQGVMGHFSSSGSSYQTSYEVLAIEGSLTVSF